MHYTYINSDKHLIMLIIHKIQILQTSMGTSGSVTRRESFNEDNYRLYGRALSPPVFFSSPELSSHDVSATRQVLVHVLVHVTHRQLNITKSVFRVDKCQSRHTRNSESRHNLVKSPKLKFSADFDFRTRYDSIPGSIPPGRNSSNSD